MDFDEDTLRLSIFIGALLLLMLAEQVWPRKNRVAKRSSRWMTNFGMSVINTVALRLLGPIAALGAAAYAGSKGWGVSNLLDLPNWFELIVAIILLDLAIYAQHVVTHHVPILWRLHRVHHVDRDIDVTTALRFHPLEIAVSMIYKCAVVFVLGPAVLAVLIFEVLLNTCAMFNHANLALPKQLDRILRVFIVTPDMHRVHHSIIEPETNSNFGFSLSIWDRLFRTYTDQPEAGHDHMIIGLRHHQNENPTRLPWSLFFPFKS